MSNSQRNPNSDDLPLELDIPAREALAKAGIFGLEQLSQMTEADVKMIHGIGPNELAILGKAMAGQGLFFKSDNPEYKVGG